MRFFTPSLRGLTKFFTRLQAGTVDAAGLNGSVRDGNWAALDIGSANATIYKRSTESKITVTANSISKKATMVYSGSFAVSSE